MSTFRVVSTAEGFTDHAETVSGIRAVVRSLTPVGDETTLLIHGTYVIAYHSERQHAKCSGHEVARVYYETETVR